MSKIILTPKYKEECGWCNGPAIHKVYQMENVEIEGLISAYSVAPLRILTYMLSKKEIPYTLEMASDDPWNISSLKFDDKYADYVKIALAEIMKYRCAYELGAKFEEIIRQLPFDVAMRTSDYIMNYNKPLDIHQKDLEYSAMKWREYNRLFNIFSSANPNDTEDKLTISKNEPELRRHLIYKSKRGGYNIKTRGYTDSSLDHYSYLDSNKWD